MEITHKLTNRFNNGLVVSCGPAPAREILFIFLSLFLLNYLSIIVNNFNNKNKNCKASQFHGDSVYVLLDVDKFINNTYNPLLIYQGTKRKYNVK